MRTVTIETIGVAIGVSKRGAEIRAARESWPYETESCRGGPRRLYTIDSLPLKVQAAIQGEQVRVTGKKRDDLQETMALVRGAELGQPMQFQNFRD